MSTFILALLTIVIGFLYFAVSNMVKKLKELRDITAVLVSEHRERTVFFIERTSDSSRDSQESPEEPLKVYSDQIQQYTKEPEGPSCTQ
jgi:hypothetical protein